MEAFTASKGEINLVLADVQSEPPIVVLIIAEVRADSSSTSRSAAQGTSRLSPVVARKLLITFPFSPIHSPAPKQPPRSAPLKRSEVGLPVAS